MKKRLLLVLLFAMLLTSVARAQDETDDAPIKVDTLLLTTPLVVKDRKGRFIAGLKKENFSIVQNHEKQDIEFFYGEESPMNVAVLLDTSGSTREALDKIQKAAKDFVKVLRPEDKGIIVTYDERTQFLTKLISDKKQLSKAIESARIAENAGTDMNAAIVQTVKNFFAPIKGRKAIIVLTDGMAIKRSVSTQTTLDALLETDTVFYPIVFKTKFYADAMSRPRKPLPVEMLELLADGTAGRFYAKEASNLKEAFQAIAEELKKQYLVGFYPQVGDTKKSSRNIKITVIDRKDLYVETKKKWQF